MGVNSLPKTVTRQRCDCDLNPGPTVPESSTLTTRLPSHPLANRNTRDVASTQLVKYQYKYHYQYLDIKYNNPTTTTI